MSISIIKPKWNAEIEAYIATIDGKKYILDIDKPQEITHKASKVTKGKKAAIPKDTDAVKDLIKTDASYAEVKKAFPKVSRSSYYQYRKRLGMAGKKKKGTKPTKVEKTTSKKNTAKAVKKAPKAASKGKASTKPKSTTAKAKKTASKPPKKPVSASPAPSTQPEAKES